MKPVLFNAGILDSGSLPRYDELEQLGYAVILFPGAAVAAAASGMQNALADVQAWVGGGAFSPAVFDLSGAIDAADFLDKFD